MIPVIYAVGSLTDLKENEIMDMTRRLSRPSGYGAMEFMAYGAWCKGLSYPIVTALVSDRLIGWAMVCEHYRGVDQVVMVFVEESLRGRGVGSELVTRAAAAAFAPITYVDDDLLVIGFYDSLSIKRSLIPENR